MTEGVVLFHILRINMYSFATKRYVLKIFAKHECIAVGCIPPARYRMGGFCPGWSPGYRNPRTETNLDRDASGQRPPLDKDLPWTETPLDRDPLIM